MNIFKHLRHLIPSISLLISLSSCSERKVNQDVPTPKPVEHSTSIPTITYPNEQVIFHSINRGFRDRLDSAKNDLQRSAVVNDCNKARNLYFKDRKSRLHNWAGKVADISTGNNGDWAFIKIIGDVDGFPISYQTHFQRWSVWGEQSILVKGTKVYNQAAQLSIGENVIFSGKIIGSLFYAISEDNAIDVESVMAPTIVLKFESVVPASSGRDQ
jgi:hypothetical protein